MTSASLFEKMLPNYQSRRHLLQNVHLPARAFRGPNFLYMKNHKAACTNILTLLMTHIHAETRAEGDVDISMESVHNLDDRYLRAGARSLNPILVEEALNDPNCFRFTVIRDPYSRTVSAWSDRVKGMAAYRRKINAHIGRPPTQEITLSQFLDIVANDESAKYLDRHWRPQCKEISYGLVAYDMIGQVEHMEVARKDIVNRLFSHTSVELSVVDTRQHLGHQSNSAHYKDGLTEQDRKNAERAYEEDLEMYAAVSKCFYRGQSA